MKLKIGTFNIQNLFLRYKVLNGERGIYHPKPIEAEDIAKYLKEYTQLIEDLGGIEKITTDPKINKKFFASLSKTPKGRRALAKFLLTGGTINSLDITEIQSINPVQRRTTTKAIRGEDGEEKKFPDILALQEVENMQTLKEFNDDYLEHHYKYTYLIDGNDERQIDVGFLSMYPAIRLRTHQFIPDPVTKKSLFSRDCLEADFAITKNADETNNLNDVPIVTFFNNHLKSHFVDPRLKGQEKEDAEKAANEKRARQAEKIAKIVTKRFVGADFNSRHFVVCGDLNDDAFAPSVKSLLDIGLENVVTRLGTNDRWTYYHKDNDTLHQFDYLLVSPSLSTGQTKPEIERRGVPKYRKLKTEHNFDIERFIGVRGKDTGASDHCPVFFEIDV
jgi:predicted extracellular nuclease